MIQNDTTFEDLFTYVTRPGFYGRNYLHAHSEEELLLILGEACCLSAFSIVQILRLPKRGRLVLKLIKSLAPKRYQDHHFQYSFSLSHCLIYITRKLKQILKRELTEEDADHIASKAYAYGGSYFGVVSKYSEQDKELFLREIKKRQYDYDKCETIDEKVLLENIFNGLGRRIPPQQVAIFFREMIEKDPLYIVEPFRFVERLKEIRN